MSLATPPIFGNQSRRPYRPWSVRTVVVRLSRKLSATYRIRHARSFSRLLAALLAVLTPPAMADLPAGLSVVAGQASTGTPTAGSLRVNQTTDKAILNWQTFNIGVGQSVQFVQPSASSVALNRVVGGGTSAIFGSLSANGQVFLVNPAGVMFSPTAQVSVGGLVASSLAISNQDFMDGRYTFSGVAGGAVDNQGTIRALRGGYVLLAAPKVSNSGLIKVEAGSAGLLSGSRVTLDTSGSGLVRFSVDAAVAQAAIANSGSIIADGGQVLLLASSVGDAMATVINQSGVIRADSAVERNGMIVLSGGASGVVEVTGQLTAAGVIAGQTGGTVKVLGDKVGLSGKAVVNVSGDAGGGTALIGGNYQGKGSEQNASSTFVGAQVIIDASAMRTGDGGKVVVWSDDTTRFGGAIVARGGSVSGDGGLTEVSGKRYLDYNGYADLSAKAGNTGTLLLDPSDITISNAANAGGLGAGPTFQNGTGIANLNVATLLTQLGGANVTVNTTPGTLGTGNITVTDAIAYTGATARTLTLNAANNIDVNAAISSSVSALTTNLSATAATTFSATGSLSTNGGNVAITGTGAKILGNINTSGAVGTGNLAITTSGAVSQLAATALTIKGTTAVTAGASNDVTLGNTGNHFTGAVSVVSGRNISIADNASLTLGAVTATGAANADGGSIGVSAVGTITATGAINSSGGVAAANSTGRNAGSITLSGGTVTLGASTLTATGGAGNGAGFAGGAGALISVSSSAGGMTSTGAGAMTASGGAGGTGNAAGGAAGTILVSNAAASTGAISLAGTGGLNARTGASVGTTAAGAAGSITVSNSATAATATTLAALSTAGNANGAGGVVNITTTGTLSVSTIATGGGAALTGTDGRDAGGVSITTGAAITALGIITASGSAGVAGTNQNGGAGGLISVTSVGGLAGAAMTASGGAAVGTGNGGNAGRVVLANSGAGGITTGALTVQTGNAPGAGTAGSFTAISSVQIDNTAAGGNLTTAAILTTGGAKADGGNVVLNASSTGTVSTGNASITTSGGTAVAQAGPKAGNVTLSAGVINLGTGGISANGSAGVGTSLAGGAGGAISLTSTSGITATGAIAASGGAGSATDGAGGAGGSITASNSTGGAISLGSLTAKTGAASGLGAGGAAGFISVSNNAAGQALGTLAIDTSGGAGGNGGNVTLASLGNASVTGTFNTSGTALAAGTRAGSNAGNVTITGTGTAVTAAITASGSASNGVNQTGGNAGTVSITGGGTIGTASINAQAGAATGTAAGGAVGAITLSGSNATIGALSTAGNANGNGGTVGITSTGTLSVAGVNASNGAGGTIRGDVTLLAGGAITQSGAIVTRNLSATTANAAGAAITLTDTANDANTVNLQVKDGTTATPGSNNVNAAIAYTDANAAMFSGINNGTGGTAGNVTLLTGGALIQSGAIKAATLTATTANTSVMTLTNAGNDAVTVNLQTRTGTVAATGTVNANVAVQYTAANGFSISGINNGASGIAGAVTLAAGGPITQTGAVNAGSFAATLTGSTSALNLGTQANNIVQLNAITAPGGFTLTNGNNSVTVAGNVTATNNAVSVDAGTGGYTQNANIDIVTGTGAITVIANTIAIGANAGGDALSTSGTLTLKPKTAGQAMSLAGAAAFDLSAAEITAIATGATGPIVIGDAASTGVLTIGAAVNLTGKTLTLNAGSMTDVGTQTITAQNITLNANGQIGTSGVNGIDVAATNLSVNTTGNASAFVRTGAINMGVGSSVSSVGSGTLDLTATGAVTQTAVTGNITSGTLNVKTLANAGAAITLTNTGNDAATVNLQVLDAAATANAAAAIAYTDTNAVTISGINNGTGVGGNVTLAAGGSLTQTGVVNAATLAATLTGASSALNLGTQTNNIAQLGPITTPGGFTLTNGNNAVVINGAITATDNAVSIASGTAATTFTAGGFIISGGGNVSLINANASKVLGTIDTTGGSATGNLTITGSGAVTQVASTLLKIKGTTSIAAGALNNVTLNNSGNDFTGAVAITSGNNVSITDSNAIILGASTVSGTLGVNTTGTITQSGALAVTGVATLAAGTVNNITLNNAGNDFTGAVAITSGNNVSITDSNAIILGASTANASLTVVAGGAITQSGAVTTSTLSAKTLANGGAAITLSNTGNDVATVNLKTRNAADTANTAGAIQYTDINGFDVAAVVTTGNATLSAGGAVTQSGAIAATGLALTGTGGAYTLNNAGNAVTTLAANTGSIDYKQSGALVIGAVGVAGVTTSGTTRLETKGAASNLTLNNAVTSSATGDAVILKAGSANVAGISTGGQLINNVGVTGIVAASASGRYLAYSGDPTFTTEGVAGYAKRYNADSSFVPAGTASTFVYRIAPTVTVTAIAGSKVYDGTAPTLTFSTAGLIDGDAAGSALAGALTRTGGKNVLGGDTVTIGTLADQLGYGVVYTGANYSITAKALTATASAANKVYNGNTTAAATLAIAPAGLIGAETVTATAGATFNTKDVVTANLVTVNTAALADGSGGGLASNYSLAAGQTAAASITAKALTATASAANKVYNGNTTAAATLAIAPAGLIGAETVTATAGATFNTKDVVTANLVTVNTAALADGSGGGLASNYSLAAGQTAAASISRASIANITGITANNKIYDATTAATLNTGGAAFSGRLGADVLTVGAATGAFANKNAGLGKTVGISALTLAGADAGNYTLSSTTAGTTADITPAAIANVTGITANNKIYDATTAATLNTGAAAFSGRLGADVLTVGAATGAFANKNAGLGKTVGISGIALGGADAGNYTLTSNTAATTANITARALGVTASGTNRVYDATTGATVTLADNRIAGDTLTASNTAASFADKNIGTAKAVSVSGIGISGTDAGNYSANSTAATTANITPAPLTVTGQTASNKVYDSTTSATLTGGTLAGVLGGDSVSLVPGTGAFADKNAGNGKTVTVTGDGLGGAGAANYTVASPSGLSANIMPASIDAVTGITANNKTYDGNASAVLNTGAAAFTGRLGVDTLIVSTATGAFLDSNAAISKTVNVSGLTLGGADAGNYTLAVSTAVTSANIATAPASIADLSGEPRLANTAAISEIQSRRERVGEQLPRLDVSDLTGPTVQFVNFPESDADLRDTAK